MIYIDMMEWIHSKVWGTKNRKIRIQIYLVVIVFNDSSVYISYNLDLYGKRKNCVNYEESKARESRCGSTRIQLKSCDCFYPGSFVSDFDKWIINYEESNVGGL